MADTISQKTACAPYDEDCPIVSSATIAQTVKKIMSKRKSDFLSFRFSATRPATAAESPIGYLPTKHSLPTDGGLKIATIRCPRHEPVKPGPRYGRGDRHGDDQAPRAAGAP